ncbi:MAG: glutaminyl-peptide cyclotransferase [Bacteroidia bacterium]
MKKLIILIPFVILAAGCTDNAPETEVKNKEVVSENTVPEIKFTVAETLPHDTLSFTEGFLFHNGVLFESTGSPDNYPYTKSIFGPVDLKTGKIEKKAELDRNTYFGEGILFVKDKIIQLTYKNQLGFIYDAKTFKKAGQFSYTNKEGWGLTTDGTNVIMSDGTNILTYLDPNTFKPVKTLSVSENGYAADYLNELEYINGFIYANIWTTNKIVKIDPATGKIVGKLDLVSLLHEARTKYPNATELNGIAFDAATNKIYVTGKLWPSIYRIEFAH